MRREILARRLREARLAAGLKKQKDIEAATKGKISQQQLSGWEAGRRVVPLPLVPILAPAIKIPVAELRSLVEAAQDEELVIVRRDGETMQKRYDAMMDKVGRFVDHYEALGHTYQNVEANVKVLVAQGTAMAAMFEQLLRMFGEIRAELAQLNAQLRRTAAQVPPAPPPRPTRGRGRPDTP